MDVIRSTLLDGPERLNHAHTLGNLAREIPFALSIVDASRKSIYSKGKSASITLSEGFRVGGIASARQRSGPQSWEISHLYLGSNAETQLLKLLDSISQIQRKAVEVELLTAEVESHLNVTGGQTITFTEEGRREAVAELVRSFHQESSFQTAENGELIAVLDGDAVREAANMLMAGSQDR